MFSIRGGLIKLNYKISIEKSEKDETRIIVPSLENFYYYIDNIKDAFQLDNGFKTSISTNQSKYHLKLTLNEDTASSLADTY